MFPSSTILLSRCGFEMSNIDMTSLNTFRMSPFDRFIHENNVRRNLVIEAYAYCYRLIAKGGVRTL
jgi:hypothetical protein